MHLSSVAPFLLGILPLMASVLPGTPDSKPQAPGMTSANAGAPGIKMTLRNTFAGMSSEQTVYLQGDRKRMEFRNANVSRRADGSTETHYGPCLAAITRCDLGQAFELNLDSGEYVAGVYPPKPRNLSKAEIEAWRLRTQPATQAGPPTLRIETITVPTGERKQIFGRTARHVITTRRQVPLAGSKSAPQETVTDGWYIDLDTRISCDPKYSENKRVHFSLTAGNAPLEKMEFLDQGEPERGFAIESKITSSQTIVLPDGTRQEHTSISESVVTELEEKPLDAALYAVPAGFRQVHEIERSPRPDFADRLSIAWYQLKTRIARLFE